MREGNLFEEREFQNTVYEEGYANIDPTSSNKEKIDKLSTASSELVLNKCYEEILWHKEMNNFGQEEAYKNEYANFELVMAADSAIRNSPVVKDENPLYQTVEIISDTAEEEDDYSILDSRGSATEEPVESRPRKNKMMEDDSEGDYDEL